MKKTITITNQYLSNLRFNSYVRPSVIPEISELREVLNQLDLNIRLDKVWGEKDSYYASFNIRCESRIESAKGEGSTKKVGEAETEESRMNGVLYLIECTAVNEFKHENLSKKEILESVCCYVAPNAYAQAKAAVENLAATSGFGNVLLPILPVSAFKEIGCIDGSESNTVH